MVSLATVQPHVSRGFAKVAAALGVTCAWYRSTGAMNPLASANLLGPLQVLFDTAANLRLTAPRQRDKPEAWFGAFDPTGVQVGDYLVSPTPEIFFVAALDAVRPARLVLCNRTIDIRAPGTKAGYGALPGYGGDDQAAETSMALQWPCAMIAGSKSKMVNGDPKLPGDVGLPTQVVLWPAIPGITVRNDMILLDDLAQRHVLSQVELSSLGYEAVAVLETA